MTLAGLNSAKPKTTIYCGTLIDTEISTDQNRPFFDHSVKRGCNFLSFLLNYGQLNDSRAADRFSSTSVGQLNALKGNWDVFLQSRFISGSLRHFVCGI